MDTNNSMPVSEGHILIIETIRKLLSDLHQQLIADIRFIIADQKPLEEKQWLKSLEVRKRLGISHGTLQRLRNNGKIPFTKIGGIIYYSKSELDKLMLSKQFSNR